jgi:hypothetical protein
MKDVLDLMVLLQVMTVRDRGRSIRTPTRLASLIKPEDVAKHRSLFCAEYDECLGEVLLHGWPSWTCRRCSRFELRGEMRSLERAHEVTRRIGTATFTSHALHSAT